MKSVLNHRGSILAVAAGCLIAIAASGCSAGTDRSEDSPIDNPWHWAMDEDDRDLSGSAVLVSDKKGPSPFEVTEGTDYLLMIDRDHYDDVTSDMCVGDDGSGVSAAVPVEQAYFNLPWGKATYFSFGKFNADETGTAYMEGCTASSATVIAVPNPGKG